MTNKLTKFKAGELLAIHEEKSNQDYGWMSMLTAKDRYSQSRRSLMQVCTTYGVPTRCLAEGSQVLFSQPAFDHVLLTADELQNTNPEDTAQMRLETIKQEEEQKIREKYRREYEQKLNASL